MQSIQLSHKSKVWIRSFETQFWQLMTLSIRTLSINIDITGSPLPLHVKCFRNYSIVRWECIIKSLISLINSLSVVILYLFSPMYFFIKVYIVSQLELLQYGEHIVITEFIISIKIEYLVCKSSPKLGSSFDEVL